MIKTLFVYDYVNVLVHFEIKFQQNDKDMNNITECNDAWLVHIVPQ